MAASLKSADPLATPISAISQKPAVNPRHEKAPLDAPPMTYSQLAAQATEPPQPELAPMYDEPQRMEVIEPVYQPQPEVAYQPPVQLPMYTPPIQQVPVAQPMLRGGLLEEAQPAKKASSFSLESNKNLLILMIVVALVLKLAAPKLRGIPRFATMSGIGLNIQGVLLISVGIVVGYRAICFAAGIKCC